MLQPLSITDASLPVGRNTREARQSTDGRDEDRQDQVRGPVREPLPSGEAGRIEAFFARNGQDAPLDAEEIDEKQRHPEMGHGIARENEHGGGAVEGRVLVRGGHNTDGDGDQKHQPE